MKKVNVGDRFGSLLVENFIRSEPFVKKSHGKTYEYLRDIFSVKCLECGDSFEAKSTNLLGNKPKKCRGCSHRKVDKGDIINDLQVKDLFREKYSSGRSALKLTLECQKCRKTKTVNSYTFTSGECSCSCSSSRGFTSPKKRPTNIRRYFSNLKSGAKQRQHDFTLTLSDLQKLVDSSDGRCSLSNLPVSFDDGTISVDRIDSSIGYTVENVHIVHRDINMMKQRYDLNYFVELCSAVSSSQKS